MKFADIARLEDVGNLALKAAADGVNSAFLWENRALDVVKETVWIDFGMPFTSEMIHKIAHAALERLDAFGKILHEAHFRQSYPPTGTLVEPIDDMDKAFEVIVGIIDETDEAIAEFVRSAKENKHAAMGIAAEALQMENSADRTKVLQAWKMWSNGASPSSFDGWVKKMAR